MKALLLIGKPPKQARVRLDLSSSHSTDPVAALAREVAWRVRNGEDVQVVHEELKDQE